MNKKIVYTSGKWKMLINHGHKIPLLNLMIVNHSKVTTLLAQLGTKFPMLKDEWV
jgi:hypothetical protein